MSTSANLPARFLITTINGKRCTAVPRSLTTITGLSTTSKSTESATRTTTSSTPETTASSTLAEDSSSDSVSLPTAAAVAVPLITTSPTTTTDEPQDTQIPTSSQVTQLSSSTSVLAITSATSSAELTTPLSIPQVATPTGSAMSISTSSLPNELGTVLPGPFNNENGPSFVTETSSSISPSATSNSIDPAEASASDSTSKARVSPGPVVGGVIGGLALVGFIAFLFWFLKRRQRYRRDSLLTTLDGERNTFNDDDREKLISKFVGKVGYQTGRMKDLSAGIAAGIAGFGASLKSKVVRNQSDTPSVNLNRGNSQFFDGPIPQHSRNNSALSDRSSDHPPKRRLNEWWVRFTESLVFNWPLRRNRILGDPFSSTSGLSEKQARNNGTPDFSQHIRINERDLQLQPEVRRDISPGRNDLGSSAPNLGSLGLNFDSNPFTDPLPPVASNASKRTKDNPFMDSGTQNKNTYVADVRRSRGLSTNLTKNDQAATLSSSAGRPNSRYPSSIGLNRDSYRDTVFSSASANARKGKGRSDPFDLERPELWMSYKPNKTANTNASRKHGRTSSRPAPRGSSTIFPDPLRMSAVQEKMIAQVGSHARQSSVAHSRAVSSELGSIYSSDVSSLAGWAGPGPDLGPGSSNTSLRGNTSSNGDSHTRTDSGGGVYGQGTGIIKGSLSEMDLALATQRDVNNVSPLSGEGNWDSRRATDNTSPISMVSKSSSRRGVGKAI